MNPTRQLFIPTLHDGLVHAVDVTGRVQVSLPDFEDLVTGWLHVLVTKAGQDKDLWLPDIGDTVAVLLDGSGEGGFVLGGYYNTKQQAPAGGDSAVWLRRFADGAVLRYDRTTHALSATLPNGGTFRVEAPGGSSFKGPVYFEDAVTMDKTLTANANIDADGTVTGKTDVVGKGVSLHDHVHGGVQRGGTKTAPPT